MPVATYEIVVINGYPAIRCTVCGFVSFNEKDIECRYCVLCHRFHEDRRPGYSF